MYTGIISTADDKSSSFITKNLQQHFPDWKISGCYSLETDLAAHVLEQQPDVIFLDMNNPDLSLMDCLLSIRSSGYNGHILLLGKASDCLFLKDAISCRIAAFLAKPLLSSDFISAFTRLEAELIAEQQQMLLQKNYLLLAREEIVRRLISGTLDETLLSSIPADLQADIYQTIIFENFTPGMQPSYQLHELLRIGGNGSSILEYYEDSKTGVILLKGKSALDRFQKFLRHYENSPQKGSPLHSLFLTYGAPVHSITDIHLSYLQAKLLMSRRFFCVSGQHTLGYSELAIIKDHWRKLHNEKVTTYCCICSDYLQSFNRRKLTETLDSIKEYLYSVQAEITEVKFFLSDLLLQIKENMNRIYSSTNISFPTNTEIIKSIYHSNYLFEILDYFSCQFEIIMNSIGNSSSESVFDDILYYINHNHHTNIKLESIAAIFGYNSAYLGKIFSKKLGESFNSYVDKVRVNHAKELLLENRLKVYEIAEQVGYKNVDYFHKKFKKYVGKSPAEYRKHNELSVIAS